MLKGEDGNAIRSFYGECHLPFLQFFQLFSEHFKCFTRWRQLFTHSNLITSISYVENNF
ncbi:T7SS effector LXG polymorphic toxin [Psychrobacillus vulpis]|nr:T7SS effector LXG polymorphic toxin [Psychrobacillus vulpis]